MRVPVSWLAEFVDLSDVDVDTLYTTLVRVGLEVEQVERCGEDVSGVVVGEVLEISELAGFKKPIRYCTVQVAPDDPGDGDERLRHIVCGAQNFSVGDRVPVAVPGAVLPGGFVIAARTTYGHVSEGMICSAVELGAGADHSGILILDPATPLGADVVELLGLRDTVLDIAVTPDRGYCLSIRGIAREAAVALGVSFRDPAEVASGPALSTADGPGASAVPVTIEAGADADLIVLQRVSGVDIEATAPVWMRRRLELAGMRSISLAVDVTNYLMQELGQPLHAFDRARVTGAVQVRRARATETLTTLDHVTRALTESDLLIADDAGPLSLAGVMGGLSSEISPTSTDLVVEAAHFRAGAVAATSRRHGLSSEASRRFERGVDPALASVAVQRAVALLTQCGGGRAGESSVAGAAAAMADVDIDVDLPGRIVGVDYSPATVRARLVDIGAVVSDVDSRPGRIRVSPPSWRPDLTDAADLVEEVARLEGYEAIPEVVPAPPAGSGLTVSQRRRRAVSHALADHGLVEVISSPFQGADALDDLEIAPGDPRRSLVGIANPLSDAEAFLRSSLVPGLLRVLARNLGRGASDLALYELGSVFLDRPDRPPAPRPAVTGRPSAAERQALDAALPEQPMHAAAVFTGACAPAGWWGPGRDADWTDAIEALRVIARAVGADVLVEGAEYPPWHPGRCARISLADERTGERTPIGYAGELHPRVLRALDLPARTCAAEIDLDPLLERPESAVVAPPVSSFPLAVRDVAVVLDAGVAESDLADALRAGAGPLLESLTLFDVYRGDRVGDALRSSAYTLRFRAPDRTLTAEDVAGATDAAIAEANRRTGARLRT